MIAFCSYTFAGSCVIPVLNNLNKKRFCHLHPHVIARKVISGFAFPDALRHAVVIACAKPGTGLIAKRTRILPGPQVTVGEILRDIV